MALSHPFKFKIDLLTATFFYTSLLQAIGGVMMSLALCLQVECLKLLNTSDLLRQATCDGCFARQSRQLLLLCCSAREANRAAVSAGYTFFFLIKKNKFQQSVQNNERRPTSP